MIKIIYLALAGVLIFISFPVFSKPLYPNSVVSNSIDFIRSSDKGASFCLAYVGQQRAEMPDKRSDELFVDGVYTFEANYSDGSNVGIWVHPKIGSKGQAQKFANHAAKAMSKLPTMMRSKLDHVVIHKGNETAFAESEAGFFVLYSKNMQTRLSNRDLEETVFHESVHATLDRKYARSSQWRKAQKTDGNFMTKYAQNNPNKEDLAESALFAWAALKYPGRLPKSVENKLESDFSSRLEFFKALFLKKPHIYKVGRKKGC